MDSLLGTIINQGGYITGSFLRDFILREEKLNPHPDIDVLIPYSKSRKLQEELEKKYQSQARIIDDNPRDSIRHFHFTLSLAEDEYLLDVFSGGQDDCCYLSPPDVDANLLMWDSYGCIEWLTPEKNQDFSLDVDEIIQRILRKECIVFWEYWPASDRPILERRLDKLRKKGWTFLN